MTVVFGGISFDGPYSITAWDPPFRAAVYAILTKLDPVYRPTDYRLLYFGESSNLSDRGFYRTHHKYTCWLQHAGSEPNLYIAIHLMPGSTEEERRKVEARLFEQYRPPCND